MRMVDNIAVFGGTGLTGSEVVYQALDRGCKVTAFCRDPSKLSVSHPTPPASLGMPGSSRVCRALMYPRRPAAVNACGRASYLMISVREDACSVLRCMNEILFVQCAKVCIL